MIADWDTNCVYLAGILEDRHPELFIQLRQTLVAHGIDVRLLEQVRDIWARDYCTIQVGLAELVKFCYDPDYLKAYPKLRTGNGVLKSFRGIGSCRRSPIVLDGGNIVASRNKAILTEKVYKENPGWSRADLRDEIQKFLQVDQLIMVPKEPYDPIGHVDGMVRFIDENTVLVNDYTGVDPAFGKRLEKVLRRHKLEIEMLPYYHERLSVEGIPSAVGCFTNFLRTEKVVIVPVYGTNKDGIALKKLEAAFRGIPVVPLECINLAREGGLLNCVAATYRIEPTVPEN